MRWTLLLLCLLLAASCSQQLTGPSSPLNTDFTLAPGESMNIDGESLTVRFNGVSGDSRCPADALCIQGGSADVRITVTRRGPSRDHVLKTGDMAPVRHDNLTIRLVELAPYPFSSRTIAPEDYRATLKVTR